MSWSDTGLRLKAVLLALLLGLSACGFEPVYKAKPTLSSDLQSVYVAPINSRVGQAARNALLDAIGAPSRNADAAYILTMKIVDDRERAGIQEDATASRVNIVLVTDWALRANDAERTLVGSGQVLHQVPFNVVEDEYASLVAERDAERLVGRLTGEAVRTRVMLLLRE